MEFKATPSRWHLMLNESRKLYGRSHSAGVLLAYFSTSSAQYLCTRPLGSPVLRDTRCRYVFRPDPLSFLRSPSRPVGNSSVPSASACYSPH